LETAWTGANEKGWFKAPRTLPLVLGLLAAKHISGSQDPSRVYLELLSRHLDEGVIAMEAPDDHAFAAGYEGPRGVRTWRERMGILEREGFIKVKSIGTKKYAYVLLVHPNVAIRQLRQQGRISDTWWEAYSERQAETGQLPSSDDLILEPALPGKRAIDLSETGS